MFYYTKLHCFIEKSGNSFTFDYCEDPMEEFSNHRKVIVYSKKSLVKKLFENHPISIRSSGIPGINSIIPQNIVEFITDGTEEIIIDKAKTMLCSIEAANVTIEVEALVNICHLICGELRVIYFDRIYYAHFNRVEHLVISSGLSEISISLVDENVYINLGDWSEFKNLSVNNFTKGSITLGGYYNFLIRPHNSTWMDSVLNFEDVVEGEIVITARRYEELTLRITGFADMMI